MRFDLHQLRRAGGGVGVWLLTSDEQRCGQWFEFFHTQRAELRRSEVNRLLILRDRLRELLAKLLEALAGIVSHPEFTR